MGSLGEPADKADNDAQVSLTPTGLQTWAGQNGQKKVIALPVLPTLDVQSSCRTITTGLLMEMDCSESMHKLEEEEDSCPHKATEAYCGRVTMFLRGEDQDDFDDLKFCVLEAEESLLVLTGREECLEYQPQVIRIAGLAADPKTNGQ